MRRFIFNMLVVAVWGLVPSLGMAQEVSLSSLVLEAVANNAEIQATREEVRGFLAASGYAGALPNPKLGVGLINLPVDGLAMDQEPMTQKQLSITQRFPWPGKRSLAADAKRVSAQKAESRLKEQVLVLQREVASLYYELWFVGESLRLNTELFELVTQATEASASRYGAGREVQRAVLAGELELSQLTDERMLLEGRRRSLEVGLNRLLQREYYRVVRPEVRLDLPQLRAAQEWVARADAENPRLEMLGRTLDLSRISLSLAEKEAMPDVDIKVAYGQREDDPMGNNRDDFFSLSVSIPVPVWKHRREDRLIASRRAGERAAILGYQGYERELPHRIEGLSTDMATALDRHLFYRDDLVPRARQLSEASVSRYEVGGASFDQMIDAVMAVLRSELKARMFLRDALVAEANLKVVAGDVFPGVASIVNREALTRERVFKRSEAQGVAK
ncbi:TolC family protein [Desulfoluna sp.]|uniref:TolC family protein n=1 Tax=Desulfoluna sp. TaxID=2045199 RepID=UPI002631A804|nr:TolC family protein [Desulfoluna sp.]